MDIHSLARRSDLIFANHEGCIEEREDYTVVKTAKASWFQQGNYLLFFKAPKDSDAESWPNLYKKEFGPSGEILLAWDTATETRGATRRFTELGFKFLQKTGYKTTSFTVSSSQHALDVRHAVTDSDWQKILDFQTVCGPSALTKDLLAFYREISDAQQGSWFTASLNSEIVASCGIFFNNELARYQGIQTHPAHRRKGICSELIGRAGSQIINSGKVLNFIIEAESESPMAKVCEKAGFTSTEKNFSLSRLD